MNSTNIASQYKKCKKYYNKALLSENYIEIFNSSKKSYICGIYFVKRLDTDFYNMSLQSGYSTKRDILQKVYENGNCITTFKI